MIRRMNGRLIPFAVFALYALITFSGQESPKHTSITVSKMDPIVNSPFIIKFVLRIALRNPKDNL